MKDIEIQERWPYSEEVRLLALMRYAANGYQIGARDRLYTMEEKYQNRRYHYTTRSHAQQIPYAFSKIRLHFQRSNVRLRGKSTNHFQFGAASILCASYPTHHSSLKPQIKNKLPFHPIFATDLQTLVAVNSLINPDPAPGPRQAGYAIQMRAQCKGKHGLKIAASARMKKS
jgi:hypothetical protein